MMSGKMCLSCGDGVRLIPLLLMLTMPMYGSFLGPEPVLRLSIMLMIHAGVGAALPLGLVSICLFVCLCNMPMYGSFMGPEPVLLMIHAGVGAALPFGLVSICLFVCLFVFCLFVCLCNMPMYGSFLGPEPVLRLSIMLMIHAGVGAALPLGLAFVAPHLQAFVAPYLQVGLALVWLYDKLLLVSEPALLLVEAAQVVMLAMAGS
uniref:Uncharacterized protein n=1 Tax=Branchiostoma floridae TaxID=7739 RepID=C4A0C8_BRAFL|eukprot:XP_002585744.1 hypothetical protein BRAFLDRAFT_111270 [Branchiostoma floridae]